jgi:hypothetical protein
MLQHYLDSGRQKPSMRMKDLGWLENKAKNEKKHRKIKTNKKVLLEKEDLGGKEKDNKPPIKTL